MLPAIEAGATGYLLEVDLLTPQHCWGMSLPMEDVPFTEFIPGRGFFLPLTASA